MKILLLGSGKTYKNNIYCYPPSIAPTFKEIITDENNIIVHLDISYDVNPDIIADVTKDGWWNKITDNYDIIIDTISHIGPHVCYIYSPDKHRVYRDIFKRGIKKLLEKGGVFYGFYDIE